MTERSPDPQNQQSSTVQPTSRPSLGFLPQAVALAGIIALTVIVTLWVSRDSDRPGFEVLIPDSPPVTFQVSGEVMRPGVYSLDGDPRIDDAINAAGGLTPDADDRRINLALRVRDGAKVVIPALGSAGESTSDMATGTQDLSGSPAATDSIMSGAGDGPAGGIAPGAESASGVIDLNTATKDQLIDLPGIGEVRADSIIEWRTNNLISSVDDLLAISGIGPATVDSIRDRVTQP